MSGNQSLSTIFRRTQIPEPNFQNMTNFQKLITIIEQKISTGNNFFVIDKPDSSAVFLLNALVWTGTHFC